MRCPNCDNDKFSVGMGAYVDVIVDSKRNVIDIDKNNIYYHYDNTDEFCYCTECGKEIEFRY